MKTSSIGGQTEKITAAPSEAAWSASQRPEFFRLPKSGRRDSHFGFSRAFFYAGEAAGFWKLVRIRQRGKIRGVTLVPYDTVSAFVHKEAAK
jgi:hypothetical protein